MTDFCLWFLIIAIVLIAFTFLMFEVSVVIPWCAREPMDQGIYYSLAMDPLPYATSWRRMAIPEHDSFTVTLPPLPLYFFESEINYDDFSETI